MCAYTWSTGKSSIRLVSAASSRSTWTVNQPWLISSALQTTKIDQSSTSTKTAISVGASICDNQMDQERKREVNNLLI